MTPAEFPHLQVHFKSGQFVKKNVWQFVSLAGLPAFCRQMKPKKFESGVEAIWLKPCWRQDSNGRVYDWAILDIEAPGKNHHSDISANLDVGRGFLRFLCEHGLEAGLIIFLSGKGLRFCWPYLIPAELQKAFRAWITDKAGFPMIDPAPFKKKSFFRMFGNRNHRNQGAVLGRHIHRLTSIHDLWFLDDAEYLSLVTGTIDLKTSLGWLQEIIPVDFTPAPWRAFLNEYKTRAALAETIYRPIIPAQKSRKPIAFLAEQAGFEFRQMQFAHGEILQLKSCPICGRSNGRAFVTEFGRLKCHHQNSCEAGTVDEQGRIVGIPAAGWLSGPVRKGAILTGEKGGQVAIVG